jgi:antitoxin component of MazEF toxin-antitoxin module
MSGLAKLTRQGNSTGTTFPREVLVQAGFKRGDELAVHATPGRIVLTPADSAYARSMRALDKGIARYGRTFSLLSK